MTPTQEMIYGELWADMARKEGHKARVPNVVPPEVKRLNQQRNRAPLTQKVINLLRERGPMQSAPASKILGVPKENSASTFNRLVKNGQISRYRDEELGRYIYYVGDLT